MQRAFNCGTGAGGFEPGNSCQGGGDGGGGGGGGGGAGGGSPSEKSDGGDAKTGPRSERLRDRIEGTDAEVKYEQRQIQNKINRLKDKIQKIEQNRPENKLKAMQKRIDEIDKASAERKEKIKASTERIALIKEQLKKYKR